MRKEGIWIVILIMVFMFSTFMTMKQNITGFATSGTTISNVTISSYLSISLSTNLSDGILFGNVTILPSTDVNASHNYDTGGGVGGPDNQTSMWINVSSDGNVNIDFCIKADADLIDSIGGNTLKVDNETCSNSSTTSFISPPGPSDSIALSTTYTKAGPNIAPGATNYYRLWLDVPTTQPAGDYNNTITFKGIKTAGSC